MSESTTTASPPTVSVRALLALAGPMIIARATQAVDGFADTYQVHHLGNDAIVATGTGALNCYGVIMLPLGVAFIVSSFVAQLEGSGRRGEAARYGWYGLLLALFAGLLSLIALPLIGPALGLFRYTDVVRGEMTDYMQVRMAALGVMVGVEALNNYYGGLGRTWVSMAAGVISMVVNIVTNWIFIDGNLGAPALGVRGAALSSVLASSAAFAFVMLLFLRDRRRARAAAVAAGTTDRVVLKRAEFTRMLRFGVPNGINWMMEFAAFQMFINVVMSDLGTTALAAFNAVMSINSLSFMPAFGIASAGSILAAQAIGSGAKELVWPLLKLTMKTTMVWMGVIGLSYVVFPTQLVSLFSSGAGNGASADLSIVSIGATMLLLSAAWQLFDAVGMTIAETLRAAGDTKWTATARLVLAWFMFLPSGYIVVRVFDGGPSGAMLCLAGYLALLSVVLTYRFRTGAWKSIQLVEPTLL
ncbi:MAG TPA: MATE family efflux transporter [Kofleriaceae bacterium]|nr:MATE family efflux transporter [Kofleriaceae bacterium]